MEIEEIKINLSKFESCMFRSPEEIEHVVKRCSCQGGDYTIKGYNCNARGIFQVTKEICETCPIYRNR